MNKTIPIIMGTIAIVLIGTAIFLSNSTPVSEEPPLKESSAYLALNDHIKQKLAAQEIQMSSPINLSRQDDLQKYCSFFTDKEKQDLVQYCTSTEIKDKNNAFLGNIHMIGTVKEPKIILVLIQTDQAMSELDTAKTIFDYATQAVICDCWNEKKPGGLANVGQWVDGLRQFHLSDKKPHSKSNELRLEGKSMQLELTENKGGYLWQFFIYS